MYKNGLLVTTKFYHVLVCFAFLSHLTHFCQLLVTVLLLVTAGVSMLVTVRTAVE